MFGRWTAAVWVAAVLLVGQAGAQTPLGSIYRMVEQKRGREVKTTERVIIADSSITQLRRGQQGGGIFNKDLVRLLGGVRVDLRLDQPSVRSNHVLSSDAGLINAPDVDWINIELADQGIYEIREDPRQLKGLEFWLKRGVMFLELLRGGISVRAAGTIAHVDGTEVLFVVNETEQEGALYLKEGTVRFPDYPELNVQAHEAWRLRDGLAPERIVLSATARERWQKLMTYNNRSVWRKPFWQRPLFYVPAAAVVVGAGVYIATRGGGDGNTASGTVVVVVPE